jgi:hypothetical protein
MCLHWLLLGNGLKRCKFLSFSDQACTGWLPSFVSYWQQQLTVNYWPHVDSNGCLYIALASIHFRLLCKDPTENTTTNSSSIVSCCCCGRGDSIEWKRVFRDIPHERLFLWLGYFSFEESCDNNLGAQNLRV